MSVLRRISYIGALSAVICYLPKEATGVYETFPLVGLLCCQEQQHYNIGNFVFISP